MSALEVRERPVPADPAALSVVVPVHERPDLAARCLGSLAAWSGPVEIVVVDDGSRDPGVAALSAAPPPATASRRLWLRNESALGFSAAINRGVAATTGETIVLLNSDAEVRPGGDRAIAGALARDPAVGAVAASLRYPDGRPQWSGGAEPGRRWLFALASGLGEQTSRFRPAPSGFAGGEVEWAPAAALAIRRLAWWKTGPFDESYAHYAQDLDYGHRLRQAGFRIVVEPAFEALHHLGGSAGSAAQAGQRLDLLWLDLLRFVGKTRGARAAASARRVLRAGGAWRRMRAALAGDRDQSERTARALAAIRRPLPVR